MLQVHQWAACIITEARERTGMMPASLRSCTKSISASLAKVTSEYRLSQILLFEVGLYASSLGTMIAAKSRRRLEKLAAVKGTRCLFVMAAANLRVALLWLSFAVFVPRGCAAYIRSPVSALQTQRIAAPAAHHSVHLPASCTPPLVRSTCADVRPQRNSTSDSGL